MLLKNDSLRFTDMRPIALRRDEAKRRVDILGQFSYLSEPALSSGEGRDDVAPSSGEPFHCGFWGAEIKADNLADASLSDSIVHSQWR